MSVEFFPVKPLCPTGNVTRVRRNFTTFLTNLQVKKLKFAQQKSEDFIFFKFIGFNSENSHKLIANHTLDILAFFDILLHHAELLRHGIR